MRGSIRASGTAQSATSIIALAVVALAAAQTRSQPKIEPALLREDFRIFRGALEEGHSGIYRYTSKAELNDAFDAAAGEIGGPMSVLDFYRLLAPLVAKIKCGHTAVSPPRDLEGAIRKSIPLFPFDVEVLNGKVYTLREYMPDEQHLAGLEVRRINGIPMERILESMLAVTPADGDSQTARPWRIGHGGAFPRLLYSIAAIESPFVIEFRHPEDGTTRQARLSGIRGDFRQQIGPVRYPEDQRPNSAADLKFLDAGRIAILTVRSFGGSAGGQYFDEAFQKIRQQHSESLIIDVRNNSGGADELGKKLLSFLIDQPFQYYEDLVLNARQFRFGPYVEGGSGVIPADMVEQRADGKFHNIKHPNCGIQQPAQPHFAGQVLALMNGGSFSTTCEFLSNLHYRHRATFLGEEAAGGYYGNTSGRMPLVVLPNTKIEVRVPLQTYYLAVKGADPKRSILPDFEIKETIEDLVSRRDRVMEKALAMARARR